MPGMAQVKIKDFSGMVDTPAPTSLAPGGLIEARNVFHEPRMVHGRLGKSPWLTDAFDGPIQGIFNYGRAAGFGGCIIIANGKIFRIDGFDGTNWYFGWPMGVPMTSRKKTAVTGFVVACPATSLAYKNFTMTVTAVDGNGDAVVGYRGSATITDDGAGTLFDTAIAVGDWNQGVATVTQRYRGAAIDPLTVTVTAGAITGNDTMAITAALSVVSRAVIHDIGEATYTYDAIEQTGWYHQTDPLERIEFRACSNIDTSVLDEVPVTIQFTASKSDVHGTGDQGDIYGDVAANQPILTDAWTDGAADFAAGNVDVGDYSSAADIDFNLGSENISIAAKTGIVLRSTNSEPTDATNTVDWGNQAATITA